MKRTFRARLGSDDALALFVVVPFDVKEELGKARLPVVVSIDGHAYRSTVAVYGGKYYVPVRKEHREAAGVKAGDMVTVTLEPDTSPRTVAIPKDLAAALSTNEAAKAAWAKLAYTHKKEHADAITGAKKPETRARRVAKAMATLVAKAQGTRAAG